MQMIKSPGVQITEKDLSLRAVVPTGTVVFVPGFAAQGPVGEPLQITTASEFESIFGTPSTPAERYFYYSCAEILKTPGRLIACRLPYGEQEGTTHNNAAYNALFYPMASGYNAELQTREWIIGEPKNISLTQKQYLDLQNGHFNWASTAQSTTYQYVQIGADNKPVTDSNGNPIYSDTPGSNKVAVVKSVGLTNAFAASSLDVNAGFIILNDLQTTVNEVAEGYYIGVADNSAFFANSPNFDSIREILTVTDKDNTFSSPIPQSRYDFALSATKIQSDAGVTSVSENLEKVGFVGFSSETFQDHVSLGVFRIRRSASDPTRLTLGSIEKYVGSFDKGRQIQNPAGGKPINAFIEDVVEATSPTIKFLINPKISQHDWTFGTSGLTPVDRVTISNSAKKLFPLGNYVPDTRNIENSKIIGEVPGKLLKVLRLVENVENIDIDLVLDAGLSTIFASTYTEATSGIASFDDTKFVNVDKTYEECWLATTDTLIDFAESSRKDCMAIIDLPRHYFVNGIDSKIIDMPGNNFTNNIANPVRNLVSKSETNYAATYANWIKVHDFYSSKRFWLPPSGVVGAIYVNNDAVAYPWFAPAGLNRGTFNAIDIAFNPHMKQRDTLYEMSVNPIVFFNGDGFTVMGQKTLQFKPTAFDRVNVRRLFLALERAVSKTIKYFVFEPNTVITRSRLVNTIQPIFDQAKNTQGVYDYLIVCDDRNNTPDTIDRNELIVDIYLKPVRAAEFILVNFIATRTGQDFSELI